MRPRLQLRAKCLNGERISWLSRDAESAAAVRDLQEAAALKFADWPDARVPRRAAGLASGA
jgi:hypothetical protein